MQQISTIRQLLRKIKTHVIVWTALFIVVMIALPASITAQYNREGYGDCAYGESCPDDGTEPPDEEAPQEPVDEEPPRTELEASTSPPFSGNSIIIEPPAVPPPPPTNVLSATLANYIERLPGFIQRALPFFLWVILLILALILLIQSAIDRHKIAALSKSLLLLRGTLAEEKNFIRIALHNLNTPLASTKSSLEMLEKAQPPETRAVYTLRPAVLELATTIDFAAMEVVNDDESRLDPKAAIKNNLPLTSVISRWYFILPVSVAVIFGIFINWALSQTAGGISPVYVGYQILVAIMVMLIVANSIRLVKLSRHNRNLLLALKDTANQLATKRQKTITNLSQSLLSVLLTIRDSLELVQNKKVTLFISRGLERLQRLAEQTEALTSNLTTATIESIPALITAQIGSLQPQIESKNVTVSTDYGNVDKRTIFKKEFSFIAGSIIDNAVKYSKEGGTIDIALQQNKNGLTLQITDSGAGMTEEEQKLLFKPFSKTEDVLRYNGDGMGLSLYVARKVTQRLGGAIAITSKKDHGTTLKVTIP